MDIFYNTDQVEQKYRIVPIFNQTLINDDFLGSIGGGFGHYGNMQAVVWDKQNNKVTTASDAVELGQPESIRLDFLSLKGHQFLKYDWMRG